MTIKGYVVRGQDRQLKGAQVWATADGVSMRRERAKLYGDVDAAVGAWAELRRCSWCADARILAVAEDGTETPLPSYEDALAQISDAHAALDEVVARRDAIDGPALPLPVRAATAAKIVAGLAQRSEEATAEVERIREEVAAWKDQASANAHGCEQRKAFQEAAEQERDEARAQLADNAARLRFLEERADVAAREIARLRAQKENAKRDLGAIDAAIPTSIVPTCTEHGDPMGLAARVRILAVEATCEVETAKELAAARAEIERLRGVVDLARRLVQGSDLGLTGGGHAGITCDEEPLAALVAIFEAEREAERLIPGLVCAECDRPIYRGSAYGGKGGHAAHRACRNWPAGTVLRIAGAQEGPAS